MSIGANLDGTKDGYRHIPTAAMGRGLSHLRPLQPKHHSISERSQFSPQEQAAIRFALKLVQGKWKVGILCRLEEGPARPGELRRLFPDASKKMLTQHLRQMERDGIITRTDMSGKVSHVEYSLSELGGVAVSHLLHYLATWTTEYLPQNGPSLSHALGSWMTESRSA
jgi:DNA-binding HxlR family transcriptional regulator